MSRPKSNRQKVIDQYIGVAPGKERGYINSLVARMIPVEDKLNVLELKAEQIIQKIMPDGFIIDPDAIAELDFGGGNKLTVQNVVDMFWQTGSIFARSFGENRIFFWCVSSSAIIALRPTSLPVPLVVGTVTKYGTSSVT